MRRTVENERPSHRSIVVLGNILHQENVLPDHLGTDFFHAAVLPHIVIVQLLVFLTDILNRFGGRFGRNISFPKKLLERGIEMRSRLAELSKKGVDLFFEQFFRRLVGLRLNALQRKEPSPKKDSEQRAEHDEKR